MAPETTASGGPYEAAQLGTTTPARLAYTAAEYGYAGLVLRTSPGVDRTFSLDRIPEPDLAVAIELDPATPQEASGAINHYRSACDLLFVRGGTTRLNRFAVEDPRVDVLTAPFADDGDINHIMTNAAAANNVAIEIRLGQALRARGGTRTRAIKDLRKLHGLLDDADAPYVVSGAPTGHLQLRAPSELRALGGTIGVDPAMIDHGLAAWGRRLQANRQRRDTTTIEPGVRRGRPDGS